MLRKLAGFLLIVGSVGSGIYLARRFYYWKHCKCTKKIENELIIITGATSGIGLALAWDLARKGSSLILACRDTQKAVSLSEQIINSTGNSRIQVEHLDLASFASVSQFAKNIINLNKPLFALINNAAIFYAEPANTVDGIEVTFQTNYLSPFLLTLLLVPALRKHESRIIYLSSEAHLRYRNEIPNRTLQVAFEDTPENRLTAYEYSKFCLTLSARHLRDILHKTSVKVHCVNPGNVETDIFRTYPPLSDPVLFRLQKPIRFFVVKTPNEGIQPVLYGLLATNPPFYIENLSEGELNGRVLLYDLGSTLWQTSRDMCKNYLTSCI